MQLLGASQDFRLFVDEVIWRGCLEECKQMGRNWGWQEILEHNKERRDRVVQETRWHQDRSLQLMGIAFVSPLRQLLALVDARQSPRHVPGCCHYGAFNREPSPTPMQGANPTIYAVVLGIMRSLVEMRVSGAVNHPDQKGLQKLSIMEILQHDTHDLPKVQKLSAVTFLRLLSLLSALPDLDLDGCTSPAACASSWVCLQKVWPFSVEAACSGSNLYRSYHPLFLTVAGLGIKISEHMSTK